MKILWNKPLPLIYPVPIVLAGALVYGRPNYATIGDTGLMGISPPLVFISSHVNHHTNIGILEHNTFSINIPNTEMLKRVDFCGIVSGSEVDKSALFSNFYGSLQTAPMIAECPVNLECRVMENFKIEHRQIFIGEVIATHIEENILFADGQPKKLPSLAELDPIIYALDNHYYRIGRQIGTGYQEGQSLVQKI